jgi:hypothetical protein
VDLITYFYAVPTLRKNGTYLPPTGLHGVRRDSFNFLTHIFRLIKYKLEKTRFICSTHGGDELLPKNLVGNNGS